MLATEQFLAHEGIKLEFAKTATAMTYRTETAMIDSTLESFKKTLAYVETAEFLRPTISISQGKRYGFFLLPDGSTNGNQGDNLTPTPGPNQVSRIVIPNIAVDAPIVWGDTWETLKRGVGQNPYSISPGEPGYIMLTAFNDIFGEIFKDLYKLQAGDVVILSNNTSSYTYEIEKPLIVESEISIEAKEDEHFLILVSWYPYLINDQYIVVKASFLGSN